MFRTTILGGPFDGDPKSSLGPPRDGESFTVETENAIHVYRFRDKLVRGNAVILSSWHHEGSLALCRGK